VNLALAEAQYQIGELEASLHHGPQDIHGAWRS
jgi:hypothetical protein